MVRRRPAKWPTACQDPGVHTTSWTTDTTKPTDSCVAKGLLQVLQQNWMVDLQNCSFGGMTLPKARLERRKKISQRQVPVRHQLMNNKAIEQFDDERCDNVSHLLQYWRQNWLRGTAVERRSLAGELSLSCARPVADGWLLMSINRPLYVNQPGQLSLSSLRGWYMSSKLQLDVCYLI